MSFVTNSDKIALIQSILGQVEAHRDGINVSVRCPNRECPSHPVTAQKKKFCIRLDDDRAHCWVCGLKGHLSKILRLHVGRDAVIKFGGVMAANYAHDDRKENLPPRLPADFRLLGPFLGRVGVPYVNPFIKYLYSRGISDRDIWHFKFGFSNEPSWRNRVIMPSFDRNGNLNWITGRTILDGIRPKYLDHDGDKNIIFNEINLDWTHDLTIVEGPFDMVKCDQNSVPLMGSEFSEKSRLFAMIVAHNTPVILGLDADVRRKTAKFAKLMCQFDIDVRILPLGEHKDVGEMTRDEFIKAKAEATQWDWNALMNDKIDRIQSKSIVRSRHENNSHR